MPRKTLDIIAALRQKSLLGPAVGDLSSRGAWLAFLKALYGLPLDDAERATFTKHTGRQAPNPGGYAEAAAIVGRQSGKSEMAAMIALYEAARAVRAGESGVIIPLVAQDSRSAQRALLGYVRRAIEKSPTLKKAVTRETSDTIELAGVAISVYPCRPAAVRGIRAPVAVVDELAHFVATDGRPTDREMLAAIRPTLATTGGKLITLSSPYAASGALYDLHRRHFGEDSSILVWLADAPSMNPTLPADYLERMKSDDPEAYRSEVLGEFRKGLSMLFDPDALEAVVDSGVRGRAPETRFIYTAFCDVASGSGSDSFALAIAHREGDVAVLDAVRRWAPPFNPEDITREAAALLQQYRLQTVTGDKYASGYQAAAWRKAGINKKDSERDTSGNYLEMLLAVNSGAVRLLDHDRALRELRTLERRTGTGGRDRVDHRRGAHDDLAAAIAGAIAEARTTPTLKLKWNHDGGMIWPEPIEGIDNRGREWRDGQPWNGDFRTSAKLIERYRDGRQVGSDGRTLWVFARRPGVRPATAPTQIHRTQYEREGDWILAEGEE